MRSLPLLAVLLLLSILSLLSLPAVLSQPNVQLTTHAATGAYSVSVDGQPWLTSGSHFFRSHGRVLSLDDASLNVTRHSANTDGNDAVGAYSLTRWTLTSTIADAPLNLQLSIKAYHSLNTQGPPPPPGQPGPRTIRALVFSQRYLNATMGTNTSRQGVISAFPAFVLPTTVKPQLGYYQWASQFFWTNRMAGVWNQSAFIYGGVENGPFVVYDATATTSALFTPFDSFMDSSMTVTNGYNGTGPVQVSYGGLGGLRMVPAGWSMSTIVYFDDVGVSEAVMRYGDVMRAVYGKNRETSANDLVNSWLGYNTDRGATYYFYNKDNSTYEQTMYMVKDYADSLSIPYRYWLSDSRWYLHGRDGGVVTWDPMQEFFALGFANLTQRLGWKIVAHNRYFSSESTYAKQNGGKYNFVVQGNSSLPIDPQFWHDLFAERNDWGLTMLFQDWLYTVSDGIDAINEVAGLGQTWLQQMATGADAAGVSIQYCMALARHLFASLQFRSVTQIRVSNDGMPNDFYNQWQIGESAVLAYALGVIPFKDNFWTTSVQCDNPYYPAGNCTEPNVVLESAVASFSTGAVAPGDGVGQSNVSLIMRSCTSEGRLLKPTRPMASLDLWYAANAFTPGGIAWQLQTTYTDLGGWRWWYVLAVNNAKEVIVTRADLHVGLGGGGALYEWRSTMGVDDYTTLGPFRDDHTIPVSALPSFTITHLAPLLSPSPLVLLGERDKWVKVSANRITAIDVSEAQVVLGLSGGEGEVVRMDFAVEGTGGGNVRTATCVIGMEGVASLALNADGSWLCSPSEGRREMVEAVQVVEEVKQVVEAE